MTPRRGPRRYQVDALWCPGCDVVTWNPSSSAESPVKRRLRDRFLAVHQGHGVRGLVATGRTEFRSPNLLDPSTQVVREVCDHEGTYLLTSDREGLDRPRGYRVEPGSLTYRQAEPPRLDEQRIEEVLECLPRAIRAEVRNELEQAIGRAAADELVVVEEDAAGDGSGWAFLSDRLWRQLEDRWESRTGRPLTSSLAPAVRFDLRHAVPCVRVEARWEIRSPGGERSAAR